MWGRGHGTDTLGCAFGMHTGDTVQCPVHGDEVAPCHGFLGGCGTTPALPCKGQ